MAGFYSARGWIIPPLPWPTFAPPLSHFGIADHYREGMRFEQFMNVSQACRAGLGVALMPSFLIDSELASGQLVKALDLPVESASAYYFVTPQEKTADAGVRYFRKWLTGQINQFT